MKGLLVKDFLLIKRRGSFYLIILLSSILIAAFAKNSTFIIGYLVFIGSQIPLSSISYDEFDNGNPFLFSLPITRKGYVAEKYVFGVILGFTSLVLSGIIVAVAGVAKGTVSIEETATICLGVLPLMVILISFTLPFQLKFGNEKGTMMIMVSLAAVFVVGFGIFNVVKDISAQGKSFLSALPTMEFGTVIGIAMVAAIVAMMISFKISSSIVCKKEF